MTYYGREKYSAAVFYRIICSGLLVLLFAGKAAYAQRATTFSFELKTPAVTSAGVFRKDSTLVRTIWNNVRYPAGKHTKTWDRKDDEGRWINDTSLEVRVLSNNVQYQWEGVIGNTSDSFTGSSVIRMFNRMHGMAVAGKWAYYTAGYTEGITSCYKFNTQDPGKKFNILYSGNNDITQASEFVATDSHYVYWAGYDPFKPAVSFIFATTVSGDSEVVFPAGKLLDVTYGRRYLSTLDVDTNKSSARGLAVQKKGDYLVVSHTAENELRLLDKITGMVKGRFTINLPRDLAVDAEDKLWVISGKNTVARYRIGSDGTVNFDSLQLSGLEDPLALAVSPDNRTICVLDGAGSQQVKAYDIYSGQLLWQFGQKGGYENSPDVQNDKFYFSDTVTMLSKPFIAFQPDSSFWVGDVGNERVQHYNAGTVFIDRIMSLPHSYSVAVDRNDATRVFNEYLEFSVDYSRALGPGNGSWTLKKNWRHGITKDYFQEGMYNIFSQVLTLLSGLTYATIENNKNPNGRFPELVELPASGNLRYTGIRLSGSTLEMIDDDGSLRRFISNGQPGDAGYWETQKLTGYRDNLPVWANTVIAASVPPVTAMDPVAGYLSYPVMTSTQKLVVFDRGRTNKGYHLGAVKAGDNKYLWKTSRATTRNYAGAFPADGAYDIGNNVEYAGGHVYASGQNIFWNYHGEFWKNSQVNKWNHYFDNGLMVGQFGITTPEGEAKQKEAFAMGAGNVFSSAVTRVGDDLYIYHNDESVHSGVHRWKISGLNSIEEQRVPLLFSTQRKGGLKGSYFDGKDLNNARLKISLVQPVITVSKAPAEINNTTDMSARFSGYIDVLYTENYIFHVTSSNGIRLWVDGILLINRWGNTSAQTFVSSGIMLEPGKLYPVKLEINGKTVSLSWSSISQGKELVPSAHLYPDELLTDEEEGLDLMEGLIPSVALENGLYGWYREAKTEDSTSASQFWLVNTNIKTSDRESPDLYINFKRDNGLYTVSRILDSAAGCLSEWSLEGLINFDGGIPGWDDNGSAYMDILDEQGKIISRLSYEMVYDRIVYPTRLKLNGEAIVNGPYKDLSAIFNNFQTFSIHTSADGIDFGYSDFVKLRVPLLDTSAEWYKPKSISFYFKGGSNNYQRAIGISKLRLMSSREPVVNLSGLGVICEGSSLELSSDKANAYRWSNGSGKQSITVSLPGTYAVTTTDAYGCKLTSQAVNISIKTLPLPHISRSGNLLVSDQPTGNQWFINEKKIDQATLPTIELQDTGNYMLMVTDSNFCTALAYYRYKSGLDQPFAYSLISVNPNPGTGIFRINNLPSGRGTVTIYDMTGRVVWEQELVKNEINLAGNKLGIYTMILCTESKKQQFKLILQ
jgi:hypothetical protein